MLKQIVIMPLLLSAVSRCTTDSDEIIRSKQPSQQIHVALTERYRSEKDSLAMATKNNSNRSASTSNTFELREGTNVAKLFNMLKDGKPHNLTTVRATLKKAGVKKQLVLVFRLSRILRKKSNKAIQLDYTKHTIQMLPAAKVQGNIKNGEVRARKATATKKSTKPAAKKATKKVVAKKPAAKKPTHKSPAVARKAAATKAHAKAVKAVTAAVGANDDDVLEA